MVAHVQLSTQKQLSANMSRTVPSLEAVFAIIKVSNYHCTKACDRSQVQTSTDEYIVDLRSYADLLPTTDAADHHSRHAMFLLSTELYT